MNSCYYEALAYLIITVCYAVPTPTINVTAINAQTVGKSPKLLCKVTTVRGITSRVDIVWSSNGTELEKMNYVSSTTMDNSLVYTDSYTLSQLNTTDDGRVIQCKVVINTSPSVVASNNITLNVSGEYDIVMHIYTYLIYCIILLPIVPIPTVTISPSGPIRRAMVGSPQVINCTVSTVSGVESSSVMISWMRPGESIDATGRVSIGSVTAGDNNMYIRSLQFTYLVEGDEGMYTCNVTILKTNGSQSVELQSLYSEL